MDTTLAAWLTQGGLDRKDLLGVHLWAENDFCLCKIHKCRLKIKQYQLDTHELYTQICMNLWGLPFQSFEVDSEVLHIFSQTNTTDTG